MFFRLLLSFVLFTGLLSAQENNGDKTIKSALEHYLIDTTLIEIFSDIFKEYDTFLDIAPIPIFDELTDLDNENVDKVLESFKRFNDLINNNQKILGSIEQSVKSSKDYDTCETFMSWTKCTFFRDKGNYSITVVQEITNWSITYEVYYSEVFKGVDFLPGVSESLDYESMYLLHDQFITRDGKWFIWNFYRPLFLPEFTNELWYTIEYMVFDDETTIFTPWGTSSNQELVTKVTNYDWDYTVNYNHPFDHSEMSIGGNKLILQNSTWSYKKEELYLWWAGIWDFESHTGTWTSFDENGIPQNRGPM